MQVLKKQLPKIELLIPKDGIELGLPYFDGGISAGFPSPAEDFKENRISLDTELVNDSEATASLEKWDEITVSS